MIPRSLSKKQTACLARGGVEKAKRLHALYKPQLHCLGCPMSGDDLRNSASLGNLDNLLSLLRGGSNPCSVDGCGLTALHHAVWNGHEECAVALLANPVGANALGEKVSCVDWQTDSGYTALMLTCLEEGVPGSEIVRRHLVLNGCVAGLVDWDGRTALDHAVENGLEVAEAFLRLPPPTEEVVEEVRGKSKERYGVEKKSSADYAGMLAATGIEVEFFDKLRDPRTDKIPVPKELSMPEHFIHPYAVKNYKAKRKDGARSIKNLVTSVDESGKNAARRELLANALEVEMRSQGLMN